MQMFCSELYIVMWHRDISLSVSLSHWTQLVSKGLDVLKLTIRGQEKYWS